MELVVLVINIIESNQTTALSHCTVMLVCFVSDIKTQKRYV